MPVLPGLALPVTSLPGSVDDPLLDAETDSPMDEGHWSSHFWSGSRAHRTGSCVKR